MVSWYRPSRRDGPGTGTALPWMLTGSVSAPENVRVTTVRPSPSVETVAVRPTAPPPMRLIANAAAALALPPVNVTGPENVTTTLRTSDRWATPPLAATDTTVGAAAAPVVALTANS